MNVCTYVQEICVQSQVVHVRADCVRAEPIIYKVVNESETPVTLVRVYVGDRPTWRTPDHPLRCDGRFKLKGVPTLIRWENGAIAGRLEDYEADKEMKIKKLIAPAAVPEQE
jgi:hypothetical protein